MGLRLTGRFSRLVAESEQVGFEPSIGGPGARLTVRPAPNFPQLNRFRAGVSNEPVEPSIFDRVERPLLLVEQGRGPRDDAKIDPVEIEDLQVVEQRAVAASLKLGRHLPETVMVAESARRARRSGVRPGRQEPPKTLWRS
jgi:hypothetical protein